jgi:hypothetical protein
MNRNRLAEPPDCRRSRAERLTLTDPWGECDLLWRNPAMKGFPLLDTAIDGWYGYRPLPPARLAGPAGRIIEDAPAFDSRLLLFYGLRSTTRTSKPALRFSLSGVLVKSETEPATKSPRAGTRRVRISLGIEGGYEPLPYRAYTDESGYKTQGKVSAGYRTLGLIAGELDGSRPDAYSSRPLFLAFQLEGVGFPCEGYRVVITEPAP